ncbi:dihydrofolate synthase / folylpolyglutamate synthase [Acetitomaculum ruminis DSM 5522]|uniref:Dihydrofolate synthase/folylpolyglutamate synthase n=1 Tax=Acetitomaculum ruminis DSM 5522 TaxID=1120918 RepID=A0A1I0Z493_9FIRM|nr:folylpolyglutamate synthase/dihydrofolate synthase family protein [Acetitomaculum ruminis]SFB20435.1 dihydrofolate synthase / folylpolyglutamate synthase [Acetitomaculum ruminis DSM 5522]
MDYEESLDYIHSIAWTDCEPGLERESELLELMGNPHKELKYIHIAGTNGKGSTAAMLASILTKAGYKTGLYTSPHIVKFNERFKINGEDISDEKVTELINYMKPFAEAMKGHPTEFELISALGFEYFKREKCDIVVLEVGLGGRLDSTNVIPSPVVSVITAIDLDHTQFLGDTVEKIAKEKSGIIKNGCKCVIYNQKPSIIEVVRDVCDQNNVELFISEDDEIIPKDINLKGQVFDYKDLKSLKIGLSGVYQRKNAALVLKIVEALRTCSYNISDDAIRQGLLDTKWISRFEVVSESPVFILDGGHNPQGVNATIESLTTLFGNKKIIFLVGVMADKDFESMISMVIPHAREFIAVAPDCESRALNADALARLVTKESKVEVHRCVELSDGIEMALNHAGKDGVICAIGSLYLSGDIKKYFYNKK